MTSLKFRCSRFLPGWPREPSQHGGSSGSHAKVVTPRRGELGGGGNPMLGSPGASLCRYELQELSRNELQRRLKQLGAPQSEYDGSRGFKALADTVLLWNVMARIRAGSRPERAQALRALRKEGISREVVEHGLVSVKVPPSESKSLGKVRAAKLLHKRLVDEALTTFRAGGMPIAVSAGLAMPNQPLLQAVVSGWRACPHVVLSEEDIGTCSTGTPSTEASATIAGAEEASALNATEAVYADLEAWLTGSDVGDLQFQRNRKFDQLDQDLANCLHDHAESRPCMRSIL